MPGLRCFRAQELVPFLAAEMGDVDHGKGVGGFDQEIGTSRHRLQPSPRFQDRQRTFQASQVVEAFARRGHCLPQNFQNGFLLLSCEIGGAA